MSILGYLSEVVKSMDVLQSLVHTQNGCDISEFLQNGKRFAIKNSEIAERAPLQLYSSGLVFAPETCMIRKTFKSMRPQCFSQLPIVDSHWGAVLQTIEGTVFQFENPIFSPDGKLVMTRYDSLFNKSGRIEIRDSATGAVEQTLRGISGRVLGMAFSPNGWLIASATASRTLEVWGISSGRLELRHTVEEHQGLILSAAFSANGEQLATTSDDRTIRLWTVSPLRLQQTLEGQSSSKVFPVVFSTDGKHIASGSRGATVRVWDITSNPATLRHILKGHDDTVYSVAFSPDGQSLASASGDMTVKMWDFCLGKLKHTFKGHSDAVQSIAYSPEGQFIVSGSCDKTIKVWDVASKTETKSLEGHSGMVHQVSLSLDGKLLVSAATDATIRVWDMSLCVPQQSNRYRSAGASLVKFSPDNTVAVSVTVEGILIWDPFSGKVKYCLDVQDPDPSTVVFSPDSKFVAAAWPKSHAVKVWDTASGKLLKVLQGHTDSVCSVAFSFNRALMAVGSKDYTVVLWDIQSGNKLQTIQNTTTTPSSLAFSQNQKRLAVGSNVNTITIFDTESGALQCTIRGHDYELATFDFVAFSNDAKLLAVGDMHDASMDLMVWDTISGELKHTQQLDFFSRVSFCENDTLVMTNGDTCSIEMDKESNSVTSKMMQSDITIKMWQGWIHYGQAVILWLPPEYRPRCTAIQGNHIALGHSPGHVSFIRFKDLPPGHPDLLPG
ncbi:hypothetical protein ASPZODRAFT_547834 [Penicilliopsis zonata CBS 506.65]|uniref:TEP-1 second beta-propeller domain-containing protein n=1 Tax=Penicilliopsis zonata CBS 506.65 TaxID=1073090 RepID=A0A1L9SDM2_9EURO|nr:hypothetical protein ASPZODRAFT_547834 [Penicilliopsis zonata CBS 506.65]OJJ45213.1 hypothetical protein ASPZODRAFT_547834 [Penicilliopsis zonata CBS 506.65]